MITNMDNLKKELKYVQEKLITSIQAVSRVSMSESNSETVIDKKLGDIIDSVESACITARNVIDKISYYETVYGKCKEGKNNFGSDRHCRSDNRRVAAYKAEYTSPQLQIQNKRLHTRYIDATA